MLRITLAILALTALFIMFYLWFAVLWITCLIIVGSMMTGWPGAIVALALYMALVVVTILQVGDIVSPVFNAATAASNWLSAKLADARVALATRFA